MLMLPPQAATEFGKSILVGWNGSREATRAVHEALPFLVRAQRVVVCAVGDVAMSSLDAAAEMLRRHGVRVEPEAMGGPEEAASEALLRSALAHRADLLVIGSYGHTRGARVPLRRRHAPHAAQGPASCAVRELTPGNAGTPITMDESCKAAGSLGIDPAASLLLTDLYEIAMRR